VAFVFSKRCMASSSVSGPIRKIPPHRLDLVVNALQTLNLKVAVRSPLTSIEGQHNGAVGQGLGERALFPVPGLLECEVWREVAGVQTLSDDSPFEVLDQRLSRFHKGRWEPFRSLCAHSGSLFFVVLCQVIPLLIRDPHSRALAITSFEGSGF
jgi:hypothetical protein